MNWHTATVPAESLTSLLARIRNLGGTIACSRPGVDGVRVTWTTASGDVELDLPRPTGSQ
jgi:hypothetical protein